MSLTHPRPHARGQPRDHDRGTAPTRAEVDALADGDAAARATRLSKVHGSGEARVATLDSAAGCAGRAADHPPGHRGEPTVRVRLRGTAPTVEDPA